VLDARVVLNPSEISEALLPRPAIRPYPNQYISSWTAKDGTMLIIRPVCPEDEPLMIKLHETLSGDSVYRRYFNMASLGHLIAHERLVRMCFIDYDREMALVAERQNPKTGSGEIVAVGRWMRLSGIGDAEMALLVSDPWQGKGIGTELLRRLIEIARAEKLPRMVAEILSENLEMQHLCAGLGFRLQHKMGESTVKAVIDLSS